MDGYLAARGRVVVSGRGGSPDLPAYAGVDGRALGYKVICQAFCEKPATDDHPNVIPARVLWVEVAENLGGPYADVNVAMLAQRPNTVEARLIEWLANRLDQIQNAD